MAERKPIGYVEATVRFMVYEGDNLEGSWNWFVYEEPGITDFGRIGTCRRECETLSARVVVEEPANA